VLAEGRAAHTDDGDLVLYAMRGHVPFPLSCSTSLVDKDVSVHGY
jgi:hypothetical protein